MIAPVRTFAGAFAALAMLAAGAARAEAPQPSAPVAAAPGSQALVAAANPLAVEAGLAVLRQGGSAVDAAVAVQAMLGLVEPQSSGIAGGAFLMHYDAATGEVSAYNGRETAPAGATPGMFLNKDGEPLKRGAAMTAGRATGVPGVLSLLDLAHKDHGKLPWSALFETTAARAEEGFAVTPRLHEHITGKFAQAGAPDVVAYFARPDGSRMQVGDTIRNPAYAAVLRRIAAEGVGAFYTGKVAEGIVARTGADPLPGTMTTADLAAYRAERMEAICKPHRGYVLCAPPPPATGVGLLYLLGLLERTDIAERGPDDPQGWYLFAEASRVMYADRDRYVGDPRFVSVPVAGLLDPAYLDSRAKLIGRKAPLEYFAGRPPGAKAVGIDATDEVPGTTHFVVRDGAGNVVSMTTTIESYFGSGRMVEGFFLNNQLTDFSFRPNEKDGAPAANAVRGGKRPRSSMTPVLILKDGEVVGAVGSPGGNAIPAYVGKTLVGMLDWNLPIQDAMALPNLVARGEDHNGEAHKLPPGVFEGLKARGVTVERGAGETSGLHGFMVRNGKLELGADPRREGVARTLED